MTTLINLTPHPIIIRINDVNTVIQPTSPTARLSVRSVALPPVDGIPVSQGVFGEIENLPAPVDGVIYITSLPVAQRAARADVLSPDTGPTAIREGGQIVAVRGLQSFV